MNNLIWILPKEKSSLFKTRGISREYLVPARYAEKIKKVKIGAKILVFLRDKTDRLFLIISVEGIEEILEGINKNDFLITANLSESLKIGSDFKEIKEHEILIRQKPAPGIHVFSGPDTNRIIKKLFEKPIIKMLKPDVTRLIQNRPHQLFQPFINKYSYFTNVITENFNLVDVWQIADTPENGPFSDFGIKMYESTFNKKVVSEKSRFLKSDPFKNLLKGNDKTYIAANRIQEAEEIYLLETEKIFARKYVLRNPVLQTLENALNKTEEAEKRHQDILRDICSFLDEKKIIPFFNSAIDLLFFYKNTTHIVEIKSCNSKNILSQASKGLLQLALLKNKYKKEHINIRPVLILEKTSQEKTEKIINESLNEIGISTIPYNKDRSWPDRAENLLCNA